MGAQTDAWWQAVRKHKRHDKATNAKMPAGKARADADHKAAAAHRKESDLPRLSSSVSVCMCLVAGGEWGMSVGVVIITTRVGKEGKEAGTVATFPTQKTKMQCTIHSNLITIFMLLFFFCFHSHPFSLSLSRTERHKIKVITPFFAQFHFPGLPPPLPHFRPCHTIHIILSLSLFRFCLMHTLPSSPFLTSSPASSTIPPSYREYSHSSLPPPSLPPSFPPSTTSAPYEIQKGHTPAYGESASPSGH